MHDGHSGGASFGAPTGLGGVADIGHDAHSHDSHGSHHGGRGGRENSGGGKVMREALNISHAHIAPGGRIHFSFSAANRGHVDQASTDNVDAIDRQGAVITYDQGLLLCQQPTRMILVHDTNHGYLDQKRVFARLAHKRRLIRLDKRVPNMDGAADHVEKGSPKCPSGIMPWHAWVTPTATDEMPDGWQPGFTGETWLEKEIWGIAKWDDKTRRWVWDRDARTVIEKSRTTWRFDQTGCYETKLGLRIISYWIYYPPKGAYGYKISAFKAHQAAALQVAEEMFAALRAAKPGDLQVALLKHYGFHTGKHPDGVGPASKEDETEMVDAELRDDVIEDLNTASDSNAAIDGAGGQPPNITTLPGALGDPDATVDGGFSASDMAPLAFIAHSGADLDNVLPASDPGSAPAAPAPKTAAPQVEEVVVTVQFPKNRK